MVLLMITDGEKWHYLAVKSLPSLLKGKHQIIMEIFTV